MSSSSSTAHYSVLHEGLYDRKEELKKQFEENAKPYRHLVIDSLCNPQIASLMTEEIKSFHGVLKETDLFKVYQTGDLANMDDQDKEHLEKLPNLLNLRKVLNEDTFKNFIEDITKCGKLSSTVDLSANCYTRGGHLLCHDDVIGKRRVSYIIYLHDPEEEWMEADGGRLELYEANPANGLPFPEPYKRLVPKFNSMALFIVEPGVSYHSVEEVFAEVGKPRVSLQGWFHTDEEIRETEKATLQRLLSRNALDELNLVKKPTGIGNNGEDDLSKEDIAELKTWINPTFLTPASLTAIRKRCETVDACVLLMKFLNQEYMQRVKNVLFSGNHDDDNSDFNWKVQGPAHLRRYLQLKNGDDENNNNNSGKRVKTRDTIESLLLEIKSKLETKAFLKFVKKITCLHPSSYVSEVRKFRRGSDYTVANAHHTEAMVDVTLCFVDDYSQPVFPDMWCSGEVGGFEVYLEREEDGKGDVAVYVHNEEAEGIVSIDPGFCTLAIVFRDEERMHFVKYLSKFAPSDRYDVAMSMMDFVEEDEGEEE